VTDNYCQKEQIVAYLDGELAGESLAVFEQHLKGCESCRADLRSHQLLLCELDAALAQDRKGLPSAEFARIVATKAENDMGGVRRKTEHLRALRYAMLLGIVAFALLGASAGEVVIDVVRMILRSLFALVGFISTTAYDAGASALVISRVLSRKFLIESGSTVLLTGLLAVAVMLLSLLIFKYYRTRTNE